MKVLIVVDMQKDFIDGALGTKEAQSIVPHVVEKIKGFDGEVIFTRDTHTEEYLSTQEGRCLPIVHCVKNTAGWQLDERIQPLCTSDNRIFDKPTFGSVELAQYMQGKKEVRQVTLIGLCTDICVISNAMLIKAYCPELEIIVDSTCCAGVTPQSHQNALEAMKMCQITVE